MLRWHDPQIRQPELLQTIAQGTPDDRLEEIPSPSDEIVDDNRLRVERHHDVCKSERQVFRRFLKDKHSQMLAPPGALNDLKRSLSAPAGASVGAQNGS